ncbi:MAG: helix-turn-helix transcriptional regulator [Thermomicrobiales bacterium]
METTATHSPDTTISGLLRTWRERRRLSQMALALDAGISTRHLSFMETGRARPSREMVLRLAEKLRVPLREQNALLLAAGYAPQYPERPLTEAAMSATQAMVQQVLDGMAPGPALAIDRHWTMQAANRAVAPLLAGVDPALLAPPVNVVRLSLHPAGLAPRIVNLPEWRAHLLARLRREVELTADPLLEALLAEHQPQGASMRPARSVTIDVPGGGPPLAVPLLLESPVGRLRLLSATMVFGTAVDVTLSELAIETFFPADTATAAALARLDQQGGAS